MRHIYCTSEDRREYSHPVYSIRTCKWRSRSPLFRSGLSIAATRLRRPCHESRMKSDRLHLRTEERGDSFFCPLCRCRNPPREPEIHEQTWTQNYLHDVESRSVAAVYFCRRIDLRRSSWSSFSIDSEWTPLADDGVGWLKLLDRFRIRSLEKMRGLSESSHP